MLCHPEGSKSFAKRSYCGVEGSHARKHWQDRRKAFRPRHYGENSLRQGGQD